MSAFARRRPYCSGLQFALLAIFALLLLPEAVAQGGPFIVRIAAIGDLHGHLRPPPEAMVMQDKSAVQAGGVTRLATMVNLLRSRSTHFAFVSAGDLVGASPLLSAYFSDEPTIEAMNLMGLDFHGIGNHELDSGVDAIRRLARGGCPREGCRSGKTYEGMRFPFLAANVIERATGRPLFPPYGIKVFDGVEVAFIGLTLRGTPTTQPPSNVEGLEFRDEAETVNALIPELRKRGVEAIVVLIHQGGFQQGGHSECVNFSGPILNLVRRMDSAVDVVISAHSHQPYICSVDGRLVTSAGAFGRLVTDIELTIDRASRDVVSAKAVNRVVAPDLPEDAAQTALIARYASLAAPLERVIGRVVDTISRRASSDGESPMGKLIADAHLEATREAGAVVAFMNAGGVRGPLVRSGDGRVNYADIYAVYPFDNVLLTMTLTGAQIGRLLEQQFRDNTTSVLQISRGFSFAWDPRLPLGQRIVPGSVMLHGRPVEAGAQYRVTVNSFNASGGDALTVLREGRDVTRGISSREALERYIAQQSPVAPIRDRRARNIAED